MNIQDVINKALSDNSDIAISEVSDTPAVSSTEITKLATALNFIGTNLEQSIPTPEEVLAQADLTQRVLDQEKKADAGIATGLVSHHNQKKRMDLENVSARDRAIHGPSALGSIGRAYGYGIGGGVGGGLLGTVGGAALGGMAGGAEGAILGGAAGLGLGGLGGSIYGLKKSTDKNKKYADEAIRAARERRNRKREYSKTASVDNALYQAAQAGMTSLQEKVAEDRINPAKISAGSADAYSGQIMPKSSPVFGGNTTPAQLINMKAQKVRARINSDMKKYVKNVGDGYNAQGHLTKFNK